MAVFINPTYCGFAKVLLHLTRLNIPFQQKDNADEVTADLTTSEKLERFLNFFQHRDEFNVDIRTFRNGMTKLKDKINKLSKYKAADKQFFFETFSPLNYTKMDNTIKFKHSLKYCQGCLTQFPSELAMFSELSVEQLKELGNPFTITKTKKPKEAAYSAVKQLNLMFEETYNTTFTDVIKKVPEIELANKRSCLEQKQKSRKMMKNIINSLNTDLASTSVERCLGTRQSFKSRQKERLIRSFETYDEAEKRTKTRLDKENTGIVKKKDHTGKVNNILWDTNALVTDINKHLANTTKVRSWSELARKHNITDKTGNIAKNGGQIAKEYINSIGMNVKQLSQERKDGNIIIRKRKKKLPGNEISVPTECTNSQLKINIKRKIENGDYTLGETIPTKKIKKYIVADGRMTEKVLETEGRKFPLLFIRKKYMRSQPAEYYCSLSEDDIDTKLANIYESITNKTIPEKQELLKSFETTRYIQVWHDASTIGTVYYSAVIMT